MSSKTTLLSLNNLGKALSYSKKLLSEKPHTKYVIFGRGRSGSTLLSSLLNQSTEIYCADEILHHYFKYPFVKLHYHSTISPKPIFGFKLLTYQLTDVHKINDLPSFFDKLILHKKYQLIYLERKNILEQAISNINAFQSGKFHYSVGEKAKSSITLDVDKVMMWLDILSGRRDLEQRLISKYPFLHLTYEDSLADSNVHQQTADQVLDFLGASKFEIKPSTLKKILEKKPLQELVDNYDDLYKKIKNSRHEAFLPL